MSVGTTPDLDSLVGPRYPLGIVLKMFNGEELTEDEEGQVESYTRRWQAVEDRRQQLGLVDLGEVMANGVREPTMLVPDLIVEGVHHLVFGEKESAKTWLLLHSAARLVVEGKTVLWIDQEMGRNDFALRLKTLGLPPDMVSERFLYSEFATFDATPRHRALWAALLEHYEPALIVVDAHTEVLATADLNENSGTDIARWHMAYMAPALAAGATTVVIDHTGHGADTQNRATGSRHKGAQSKVELKVSCTGFDRSKTGTMTVQRQKNTPAAPIPEKQTFEVGGDGEGGFVFEPGRAKTAADRGAEGRKTEVRRRVLEIVRHAASPPTQSQLTGMVGGNKSAAVACVQALVGDGLLDAEPTGRSLRYTLTPQGELSLRLAQDQA